MYGTPLRTARISGLNDHFWLKYDGEKWSRKNYFEIPRAPSEIPTNQPGQFGLAGQIFLH